MIDNKNHKIFTIREYKSYAKNLIGQKVIIHNVFSVFYPEIRQLVLNGFIYKLYSVRDDYENLKYVFAFFIFLQVLFIKQQARKLPPLRWEMNCYTKNLEYGF